MKSPLFAPQGGGAAGSSGNDEPVFLAVGRLRRAHGVSGEIRMDVLTDFPERLEPGVQVYAGPQRQPLRLRSVRSHQSALLVAFDGIDTPEQAGELRNLLVQVRADDRPALPEGEYYHHQILGLKVFSEAGEYLGEIREILETGANDVYLIRAENGAEILLPAVEDVVLAVDLERAKMRVRLLPGLSPGE